MNLQPGHTELFKIVLCVENPANTDASAYYLGEYNFKIISTRTKSIGTSPALLLNIDSTTHSAHFPELSHTEHLQIWHS